MKLTPIFLGNVSALRVYGGMPEDFADSWACLEDCHEQYFSDDDKVTDQDSYADFIRAHVVDAAVARNAAGEICGASYIVRDGRRSACFHGFCAPEFRTPAISLPCAKLAIRYFITAHWLARLGVMGRWSNRVARLYAQRQGFTIEGRLRKYAAHGGKLVDCYYGSILREEV